MNLAHETTLYSTVVRLVAVQNGTLPATQGRLAHAAFFDIIRSVDPALADTLHAGHQRKPFTVSPLYGLKKAQGGRVALRQGRGAWLRFTLLGGELFAAFTRRFLVGEARPAIRIGEIDFAVTEVLTMPGSHPWAGYTTLDALQERWESERLGSAAQSVTLQFASPTVFSRGTRDGLGKWMEPFPTPVLLFGSLAAAWNRVSPQPLDKAAVRAYAEETVVVGLYRMASKMMQYWGQPQIGAVGTVTFLLRGRRDHEMIRALNTLADFAFYSGVGYKTTMGMGQVRRKM
jgi:CRISPR-associated endoribonuclease Cas6